MNFVRNSPEPAIAAGTVILNTLTALMATCTRAALLMLVNSVKQQRKEQLACLALKSYAV